MIIPKNKLARNISYYMSRKINKKEANDHLIEYGEQA